MKSFTNIWKKLTHWQKSSNTQRIGDLEELFFNSAHKVAHLAGLASWDRSIFYLLYSNIVKLMIVLVVCGEVWYMFAEASSLDEIAASINTTVIQFITAYRYRNMINHQDLYKKLATAMESPAFDISTKNRQMLVYYWAQKNERYLKLVVLLGNCTLAAWFIFPLIDEIEHNMLIGVSLPFDYRTPVRYFFSYILVAIAFIYSAYFVMVTDINMQAHLIHLLCQFTVLADCFENLVSDCTIGFEDIPEYNLIKNKDFKEKYVKRLGDMVEQHKLILSNTMNLRDSLSGPMLGQLAASGTLICFVGYQAATTITESIAKCLMAFLFLGYNVFELYVICRWCEEVTVQVPSPSVLRYNIPKPYNVQWFQSRKIGESIYCSGWECGVSQVRGVRATIMFVIARANDPLMFTAGGMYDLSLSSYTTLVKTSYSALTILLRFRHD